MRDYGNTNAAPYASAPAVGLTGDTYWNTTDSSLYVSNGTAWVKAGPGAGGPPSGTAGGDLSGTYPNPAIAAGVIVDADVSATAAIQYTKLTGTPTSLPGPPTGAASGDLGGTYPGPTIAASAVRGTPSSGGTAREIAKASIWGGDDLIDASVPWAKLALQSYARVSRVGTAQSIASGTGTAVIFDTAVSNVGGLYSAGTPDRFTIQQAGVYLLGGSVQIADSAGGTYRELYVAVAGGAVAMQSGSPGSFRTLTVMSLGALTVSQVVQLFVVHDAGTALTLPPGNFAPNLWIARVA